MAGPNGGDPSDPNPPKPRIGKSGHAKLRSSQGRPVGQAVNDVQRAGPHDIFIQVDDDRFVIRGPGGREHVVEPDGELVTSLHRSAAAHAQKVAAGQRRPATEQEFEKIKDFVR